MTPWRLRAATGGCGMRSDPVRHLLGPILGSVVLFGLLVGGSLAYTATGGAARDDLVTQMLINAIVVTGIGVYVGNTGVMSFGHVGFGAIAGYTFAVLAISPERKAQIIPDAPFGLAEVSLHPAAATLAAIGVTLVAAFIIGLGLTRSGARTGAISAAVITLALLFVVHEVARNWTDLTGGGRSGISFSLGNKLEGRTWIYVLLFVSILVARLFRQSGVGRLAQAAREDDLAARAVGINPAGQQMVALLLSVVIVAVGAALRVYALGVITPRFFFFEYTLITLAMLIVGGRNSVTGALLGTVVMTIGLEGMRYAAGPNVNIAALDWLLRDGLTGIFLGGAMLGFMIFRSSGLLDDWELDAWLLRRRRRRRAERSDASPAAAESPPPQASTLAASDVTVDFGGFRALDGAHVEVTGDEVVGLIGPNGAGKTTLLNVIGGVVAPASGRCIAAGRDLTGAPTHVVARGGLVRTFQNLRLFGSLTVQENVEVAALVAERHRPDRPGPDTETLLRGVGLWDRRARRARELDYGGARRLELARAAAARRDFLLLDEPTSGMSDNESLEMIHRVRTAAAAIGAGVLVIDHDLNFIIGICDRVYTLDQGKVIAVGTPAEIGADPLVQAAYLGSDAGGHRKGH
ncbi:MAG: ATP-binding cassette domain-containing protein [bacterium]|nr:ATP-binding cassette domain-containing protein [bacterium]